MYKTLKNLTVLVLFGVISSRTGAQSVRNFDLPYHSSGQNMKVYFDRADLEEIALLLFLYCNLRH